ncbi:Ribosomal RNA small subunit methyltransferase D [Rhodobacteraceae bacterium THAF1]|uniref:16S rRNA (guanine(966)-N(2))-methyltransferase RsmD n=1 Tax=Palleronia sp. THAF1 TaxID=2587842 RepID=UPI000F3EFE00|nr:16S rRNA (guanine(966)-N(2))-methyltransferase RsmD [Palleronia sp. THAF1]QFU07071.1 Ribosomal RNA small subunit methyltransferase D [Palleronia sp. THAF1]VDC16776.1 Ribosomal RNA small subunit methyltransferase D [Rhodobacteraceae bacterium THAF1]
MRIIAGRHRGRALADVGKGDTRNHLRPTTDRVRESLFNVLTGGRYGDPITDARVLDLFAGTGALGLEALSRGADHATFVDSGRAALTLLGKNIALLAEAERSQVFKTDATRLPPAAMPATLVFLDPPYGQGLGERAMTSALAQGWIAEDALIVWEESSQIDVPPTLEKVDARRYGDTWITLATVR